MRTQYLCFGCTFSVPRRTQRCPVCGALMQPVDAGPKQKPAGGSNPFAAVPFVP
jgi:predicted ATP-dependent serine protease